MAEIILSFFAVIGLMFVTIYTCDYLFYRKFKQKMTLVVNLSKSSIIECIDTLELIATIRQMTIGKAAIPFVQIIIAPSDLEAKKLVQEYMRVFKIPGEIKAEL